MVKNIQTYTVNSAEISCALANYKTECRYLKSVSVQYDPLKKSLYGLSLEAEFSIPQSFYLNNNNDHFNAVEYVICFNQIAYIFFMQVLKKNLIKELAAFEFKSYMAEKRQDNSKLSADHFIVRMDTKYRNPINSNKFYGKLTPKNYYVKKNIIFVTLDCEFSDDDGGAARGRVLLAHRNNVTANYTDNQ